MSLVGETLGKYKITKHLGRGGMAEVYKGYHEDLDRHVAIKVLHSFLADEENFLTRFRREAKAVAALRHANIVQVFDFDFNEEKGIYYMVMEHIDGPDLKERLQEITESGDCMPVEEAVRVAMALGEGLSYAHQRGMIHRDVKPANIMFTHENQVVLTDFGIAKMVDMAGLTASGAMVGTPAYISPEQGMGKAGDERSDIYSLGVVLYQMLTGDLPFDADTSMGIVLMHINEPLPSPCKARPDLPADVERVVVRALAKEPDQRYQTAAELVEDLGRVLSGQTISAPPVDPHRTIPMQTTPPPAPPPAIPMPVMAESVPVTVEPMPIEPAPPPRRRRRGLGILFVILFMLVVAVGGFFAYQQGILDGLLEQLGALTVPAELPSPTPTTVVQTGATLTAIQAALGTSTPTPTVEPTSTPTPTATPTATPTPDLTATAVAACVFDMALVEDVPLLSDALAPTQVFTKAWVISNTGTCTWQPDFELIFIFGTRMDGAESLAVSPVEPGGSWQVMLELRAPDAVGTYTGAWQLQDGRGDPLGERLEVEIQVDSSLTLPPPTPTPFLPLELTSPSLLDESCWVDAAAGTWGATVCWNARGGTGEYRYFVDQVDAAFELDTSCHEFTAQAGEDHSAVYFITSGIGVFWPLPEGCCTEPSGYYETPEGDQVVWRTVEVPETDCP